MADLESEVSSGQIEIEQLREGVRVSVSDDIIFASGSAELDPLGRKVLEKVSQQLLALDHSIEVQGHTDDLGLKPSLAEQFPSNWDLAAARASRVVRLMEEQGIPGERMRVVSFASFQPLVPNESPESRAQNRRIEIRLKPKTSRSGEYSSDPADGG
jgi:chemotaxis protein MotB